MPVDLFEEPKAPEKPPVDLFAKSTNTPTDLFANEPQAAPQAVSQPVDYSQGREYRAMPQVSWWQSVKDFFHALPEYETYYTQAQDYVESRIKVNPKTGSITLPSADVAQKERVEKSLHRGEVLQGLKNQSPIATAIAGVVKPVGEFVASGAIGKVASTPKAIADLNATTRVMLGGAAYGGSYNAIDQANKTGVVHPNQVFQAAIAGGLTAGALFGAAKSIGIIHSQYRGTMADIKAKGLQDKIQSYMDEGLNAETAVTKASRDLKIVDKEGNAYTLNIGDKIKQAREDALLSEMSKENKYAGSTEERAAAYYADQIKKVGQPETPIPHTTPKPTVTPPEYVGPLSQNMTYAEEQAKSKSIAASYLNLPPRRGGKGGGMNVPAPPNAMVNQMTSTRMSGAFRPYGAHDTFPTWESQRAKNAAKLAAKAKPIRIARSRGGSRSLPLPKDDPPIPPSMPTKELVVRTEHWTEKFGLGWVGDKIANIYRGIYNRINDYAPATASALRKFEMNSSIRVHKDTNEVLPFLKEYRKLSTGEKDTLKSLLHNEDVEGIKAFTANKPELQAGIDATQTYFKRVAKELQAIGKDIPEKDFYWPRSVKDYKGLYAGLSGKEFDPISKALNEAATRKGGMLDPVEVGETVDKFFRNRYYAGFVGNPSFLKGRVLTKVPKEVLDKYEDPYNTLHTYIHHTAHNIEKRNFFGFGPKDEPLSESISRAVLKDQASGNMLPKDVDKVKDLLMARFGAGEQGVGKGTRVFKNIFYASTLGQFGAAGTQIGDLGVSSYVHGFIPTLKGMVGKKWASVEDLGVSLATEEMADTRGTARLLQNVLTWSGFRRMDRLGKNTQVNAAFRKYHRMSLTERGRAKIAEKYRSSFTPEEMDNLMRALQQKQVTPETKLLLWHELSNTQPISLSELPAYYVRHPSRRIFYMLQTFTTKQLTLFYEDALKKMIYGNAKEKAIGAKNAVAYIAVLTAANYGVDRIKEAMRLKAPSDAPLPEAVVNAIWRNFGLSSYVMDQLESPHQEDFYAGLAGIFATPVTMVGSVKTDVQRAATEEDYSWGRLVKRLPVVGSIYMMFGGGFEDATDRSERYQEYKQAQEDNK